MKRCYYVEGWSGWFVVRTTTKRRAYSVGVREFGRGRVKGVRPATAKDTHAFVGLRGQATLEDDEVA